VSTQEVLAELESVCVILPCGTSQQKDNYKHTH